MNRVFKNRIIIVILIFIKSFVFGHENRMSVGLSSYMDSNNLDSERLLDYVLIDTSYELLINPFEKLFCNLSIGMDLGINPFINIYALSINLKGYMENDFSGFFFGVSPLSDCNFGNLFSNKHFINYDIGFLGGYNLYLSNQLDFETMGKLSFSMNDLNNRIKVRIIASFCYRY